MKQTEIIAQLKSLRLSQAAFADTSDDDIFARDVEALDAAIATLERIRWRKVSEEMPEKSSTFVLALTAPGELSVGRNIIVADYIHPVNEPCGAFILAYGDKLDMVNVTHWAYLHEPPEETKTVLESQKGTERDMTDREAIETIEYAKAFDEHTRLMVALDCAVSALQERIDREKGCEWCYCESAVAALLDAVPEANFCPLCGRKLKTGGKHE